MEMEIKRIGGVDALVLKPETKTVHTTIHLKPSLFARIQAIAAQEKVSFNRLVELALSNPEMYAVLLRSFDDLSPNGADDTTEEGE